LRSPPSHGRQHSRERADVVMEQCGLTEVSRRIIGQLSKGYRQRVGLADALVHEPELIILDEPTIGLDPNQIRSVRQLIKGLGGTHTVLISTHILPEAEMTCHRVVIMYEGKILAADTPENLQRLMSSNSQIIAEIAAPPAELQECWTEMAEVEQFDVSADVWSATSYKLLRGEALNARRWNMLHPTEPPRKSYLESVLEKEQGVFVAVSDYIKLVPDQIAPWVPGGLMTLGTDGFGRSDTRARLRRFFEVDAETIVVATLYALAQRGQIKKQAVHKAIKDLKIDPEKKYPFYL